MTLQECVPIAGALMEGAGIATMLIATLIAGGLSVRSLSARDPAAAFRIFRQALGRGILLGLEFLVAADIIRTVSEIPSLERVLVLAIIVLIRTFLSFTVQVELEGRWPWQRAQSSSASRPG